MSAIQTYNKSKAQRDLRKIQNISKNDNNPSSRILNISAPYVNRRDKQVLTNSPLNNSNQMKNLSSTNQSYFSHNQQSSTKKPKNMNAGSICGGNSNNGNGNANTNYSNNNINNTGDGTLPHNNKILNSKKTDFLRQYLANTFIQKKQQGFKPDDNNLIYNNDNQVSPYLQHSRAYADKENKLLLVNTDMLSHKIEQILYSNTSYHHLSRPCSVTNKALVDKENLMNYFVSPKSNKYSKGTNKFTFLFPPKEIPKETINTKTNKDQKDLACSKILPKKPSHNIAQGLRVNTEDFSTKLRNQKTHDTIEDNSPNSLNKTKQVIPTYTIATTSIVHEAIHDNKLSKTSKIKKGIIDEKSLNKSKEDNMPNTLQANLNGNSKNGTIGYKNPKQKHNRANSSTMKIQTESMERDIPFKEKKNLANGIGTPNVFNGQHHHHYNHQTLTKQINLINTNTPTSKGKPPLSQAPLCLNFLNNSGNIINPIMDPNNLDKYKNLNIQSVKENKNFEFPVYLTNYTCESKKKPEEIYFKTDHASEVKNKPKEIYCATEISNGNDNQEYLQKKIENGIRNFIRHTKNKSNVDSLVKKKDDLLEMNCPKTVKNSINSIKHHNPGSFYNMITDYIISSKGSNGQGNGNKSNVKVSKCHKTDPGSHLDLQNLNNNNTLDKLPLPTDPCLKENSIYQKIQQQYNSGRGEKGTLDAIHYNAQIVTTQNISNANQIINGNKSPIRELNQQQDQSLQSSLTQHQEEITILDQDPIERQAKEINFIKDYNIYQQIGQGAYATVRLAIYVPTNQYVAIKIYEKQKIMDPMRSKSVKREIKLMERMDHQNIVKIYDTFETTHHLNIVMEYIGGHSLYSLLKEQPNRRLKEENAYQLFKQAVCGIAYCHSRCITHRDIKLENLLINSEGIVKIIDFGFSTLMPNDKKVRMFCGTPSYMAPEIVLKKEYCGPPADIWALGVLLYTLLCGTFPFKGATDKELYRKICKGEFIIPDHLSEAAVSFIQMILNVDAEKRPTAKELFNHPWMMINAAANEKREMLFAKHKKTLSLSEKMNKQQELNLYNMNINQYLRECGGGGGGGYIDNNGMILMHTQNVQYDPMKICSSMNKHNITPVHTTTMLKGTIAGISGGGKGNNGIANNGGGGGGRADEHYQILSTGYTGSGACGTISGGFGTIEITNGNIVTITENNNTLPTLEDIDEAKYITLKDSTNDDEYTKVIYGHGNSNGSIIIESKHCKQADIGEYLGNNDRTCIVKSKVQKIRNGVYSMKRFLKRRINPKNTYQ